MKSSGLLLAKMIDAEKNYKIHDAELLAVVKSFRHLRHYLEQPCHTVDVVTDYSNLRAFMTTRKLTRRQVQLALNLSVFDFRLVYYKETLDPADSPRRLDYQRGAEPRIFDNLQYFGPSEDVISFCCCSNCSTVDKHKGAGQTNFGDNFFAQAF